MSFSADLVTTPHAKKRVATVEASQNIPTSPAKRRSETRLRREDDGEEVDVDAAEEDESQDYEQDRDEEDEYEGVVEETETGEEDSVEFDNDDDNLDVEDSAHLPLRQPPKQFRQSNESLQQYQSFVTTHQAILRGLKEGLCFELKIWTP